MEELDVNLDEFIKLVINVLELHSARIKTLVKNFPLEHAKFYQKILKSPKHNSLEHRDFFLSRFKENRLAILSDKSDTWISEGDVIIQWCEGQSDVNKKYRIDLSVTYKKACELRNETNRGLKGMNVSGMFPEMKYPDTLLGLYYKIVSWFLQHDEMGTPVVGENKDVERLNILANKYIPSEEKTSTVTSTTSGAETPFSGSNDLINNLAKGLMNNPEIGKVKDKVSKMAQSGKQLNMSQMMSEILKPDLISGLAASFGMKIDDQTASKFGEAGKQFGSIMENLFKTAEVEAKPDAIKEIEKRIEGLVGKEEVETSTEVHTVGNESDPVTEVTEPLTIESKGETSVFSVDQYEDEF